MRSTDSPGKRDDHAKIPLPHWRFYTLLSCGKERPFRCRMVEDPALRTTCHLCGEPDSRWQRKDSIYNFPGRAHPGAVSGTQYLHCKSGLWKNRAGVRNVSDETSLLLGPDVGGDEPVLIARSLPGIPVIVSEKRIEGILLAKRRFRSQIILLDDGFQHRSVFRDLDIVMIDCSLPMRMWAPLPAGIFRESAFDLNRAGLVVLNGETTEWQRYHLRRWVARLTKAPVLEGKLCFSEWKPLFLPPGCRSTPSPDQPSAVITGIARPQRFIHELEQQGFHHLVHFTLRDHSRFRAETCSKLLKSAVSAGARQIVITSKDGVKWSELPSPIPVYVFETAWKPSLTLEPLVNRLDALMGSDHLK